MKIISFRTTDENMNLLQKTSKELGISISAVINYLITNHLKQIQSTLESDYNNEPLTKILQIKFTQKEFNKLQELRKAHLHSSVTKEAKYHILNAIYDNKFLSQIELSSLALSRAEIQKIGVNLNQLIRLYNTNKVVTKIPESTQQDIQTLIHKIDELKQHITTLIDKKNERINKS